MKDLIIGYDRVSTSEQDLTLQVEALKNAGCTKIFKEKVTGTSTAKRTELKRALDVLTTLKGGTLIITRVDRLARSMKDLQDIVHLLKEHDVCLKSTEQPIDTSTPAGKAFFDMLGVFAEFETNLRRERQLEGIAKAKKSGKYKGRKPTAKAKTDDVLRMIADGVPKPEIAERLNIGIASVYRIIK